MPDLTTPRAGPAPAPASPPPPPPLPSSPPPPLPLLPACMRLLYTPLVALLCVEYSSYYTRAGLDRHLTARHATRSAARSARPEGLKTGSRLSRGYPFILATSATTAAAAAAAVVLTAVAAAAIARGRKNAESRPPLVDSLLLV
ncbi:hypothetical protein EJ08DRAFT_702365 [Tothia fuscella]|uniref:Uncharacterized protein n=1 Tax=Tothia fuscella TaxID=1048955 RepID=A0A9P4NGC1_9PEZI|nr:hypothetical protein EJ08DRAFT_702365 [Tothia fuscella]